MRLASVRLRGIGPFEDTTVRFDGPETEARSVRPTTVLFGGDGTGKTTLLAALALTRPGYALPPLPSMTPRERDGEPPGVFAEWLLGVDDPERPHPLVVASPSALLPGESNDAATVRRREQALFDRKAQSEGGFVFVAFSGARWFSRTPNLLTSPERSVLRYDVRAPATFDDPSRADLAREVKQVLAYAAIGHALGRDRVDAMGLARLDQALQEVLAILLEPFGCAYVGTSARTLEPELRDDRGRVVPFEALPRPARHLAAFGVLALRALAAAYPDAESDPREHEGVVAIDDVEMLQEPAVLRSLTPLLRRALPGVQWLLTTASAQLAMACAEGELVTLRRSGPTGTVEIGEGILH